MASEFHEIAYLACIHEAEFKLALSDHLLARIETDDFHLVFDRIHNAGGSKNSLDHHPAAIGHGGITNTNRLGRRQSTLERVGGRNVRDCGVRVNCNADATTCNWHAGLRLEPVELGEVGHRWR